MVFVETSLFTNLLGDYLGDEEYRALQNHLIAHPDAGVIIKGAGGVRKIRWRSRGKGKSGSSDCLRSWAMTRRDIGKEIIEGLEEMKAWRLGRTKLRTTTVELPRAVEVPAIRKELGLSQEQFAALMGVSIATLRNWEQGRREPHGPARSLLLVASREPAAVLKALTGGAFGTEAAKPAAAAQKVARYRVSRRTSKRTASA